jgi:site-specific DNA recombinase
MIADAEKGLFDVILVHKLDRFSRSLLDVLTYLDRLGRLNVSFVSATEQFDFSTPFGKVILAMLGAFAQWYLDNLRTEIIKGKKERARQGGWNGTLSFGYTTPKALRERLMRSNLSEDHEERIETALEKYDNLDDSDALPCPFDSRGVKMAFELYATGEYSDNDIATRLNEQGYRTARASNLFTSHTVREMFTNRFYLGETSYNGGRGGRSSKTTRTWMDGNHEAIVTSELFEQVQQQRGMRAKKFNVQYNHQNHFYPLSGLLVDECGITWNGHFKRGERHYRQSIYKGKHSDCDKTGRKTRPANVLETQIADVLDDLEIPQAWYVQARKEIQEVPANYETSERTLIAKLDRLKKLYIEGDLSEKEYDKMRADIRQRLSEAQVSVRVTPN